MADYTEVTSFSSLKVGDTVSIPIAVYRRWWQFWRPHIVGQARRKYVITKEVTADAPGAWTWTDHPI